MKKILLIVKMTLICSLMGFAQLPVSTLAVNKNVVLEEYTGIRCTFCPDGHKRANAIKAANPGRVVLVNIHTGSYASPVTGQPDYTTTFGAALATQTGLTGYPSGTVNRHIFSGTSTASSRGDWAANSTTILGQSSYVNVALEASIDIASRVLTVNTEVYFTGTTAPAQVKLNVALMQNNILGPQTGSSANPTQVTSSGDYIHSHMLRHLLTGQWGDTINSTSSGTTIARTYTYTIPAALNSIPMVLGDMEVAAFIAEGNQEIITGAYGPLSFIAPPGVSLVDIASSSATVNPTSYCASSVIPKVMVTNNGTVAADTFQVSYSLNGGTPVVLPVYTSLAASASTTITFPSVSLPNGTNNFAFNCNVNNANKLMEVLTSDNPSGNPEIITVSSTPISRVIAEQFEGFAYASAAPADAYALNPNGISAFILNTANVSSTAPPIGGFGNSDGVFRWRYYNIAAGESSSLMYDKLTFAGRTGSKLEFDLSYAQYDATSNDKLDVLISTDCGTTWTSIYSKSGSTLSTRAAVGNNTAYYPASNEDWRLEVIDLTSYDNQTSVLIKFTGTSDFGNNLYLDNIRIVDAASAGVDENDANAKLNIFPNPSNGLVTINYASANSEEVTVNVINAIGATVYTTGSINSSNLTNKNIDLSTLPKGVYMVNVIAENAISTKKLVIQ